MLTQAARDLNRLGYNIRRCLQSGLGNFVDLRVTTRAEMQEYRAKQQPAPVTVARGKETFKNKRAPVRAVAFGADLPWSTIKVVERGAVRAFVDAD